RQKVKSQCEIRVTCRGGWLQCLVRRSPHLARRCPMTRGNADGLRKQYKRHESGAQVGVERLDWHVEVRRHALPTADRSLEGQQRREDRHTRDKIAPPRQYGAGASKGGGAGIQRESELAKPALLQRRVLASAHVWLAA